MAPTKSQGSKAPLFVYATDWGNTRKNDLGTRWWPGSGHRDPSHYTNHNHEYDFDESKVPRSEMPPKRHTVSPAIYREREEALARIRREGQQRRSGKLPTQEHEPARQIVMTADAAGVDAPWAKIHKETDRLVSEVQKIGRNIQGLQSDMQKVRDENEATSGLLWRLEEAIGNLELSAGQGKRCGQEQKKVLTPHTMSTETELEIEKMVDDNLWQPSPAANRQSDGSFPISHAGEPSVDRLDNHLEDRVAALEKKDRGAADASLDTGEEQD